MAMFPEWVMEAAAHIVDVPDCAVCGEPVMSERPTHVVCSLIRAQETNSFPVVFVVGVAPDGA